MKSNVRVVVDERERRSGVPNLLKSMGLTVQFTTLDVGDYVVTSGYVVERKTVNDFIRSIYSGRLFDQVERLLKVYEASLVLVEGDLQDVIDTLSNPNTIWGAVATLLFTYGIRVFITKNRHQTASFIHTLAMRNRSHTVRPRIFKKLRVRTLEEAKIGLLSSLPGIGAKLAHRLLVHFGSARKVFGASAAELAMVEGIGRVKADRIVAILDSKEPSTDTFSQVKLTTLNE
ncbi:MAG: ERCC4 domain-containing protein [Candidatus Bathyarchaeia archaeon]